MSTGPEFPAWLAFPSSHESFSLAHPLCQIATTLGVFLGKVARDYATGQLEKHMESRAIELRRTLASLGPSFVKIGQGLSSRPDLLPRVYLEQLSSLQDRLPSFPDSIAMRLIEEELGRPVDELFAELSEKPVAAASLGQVSQPTFLITPIISLPLLPPMSPAPLSSLPSDELPCYPLASRYTLTQ